MGTDRCELVGRVIIRLFSQQKQKHEKNQDMKIKDNTEKNQKNPKQFKTTKNVSKKKTLQQNSKN